VVPTRPPGATGFEVTEFWTCARLQSRRQKTVELSPVAEGSPARRFRSGQAVWCH
jgi:hypothetical protein